MGWDYTYGITKSELIHERTETKNWINPDGDKIKLETLRHCCKGNVLWAVRAAYKNGEEMTRFISCDLLAKNGDAWGYKDMEESMYPYYYSCPLSYLDLAPMECEEWREGVRKYHAKRKRKVEVGKTYQLVNCRLNNVRITSLRPLEGVADNGRYYKIPKKMLGEEVA